MPEPCDLLVRNLAELVTMAPGAPGPLRGKVPPEALGLVAGPAAVAIGGGKVLAAGPERDVAGAFSPRETLDAEGRVGLPGFVDPHTHPVFVGTREDEFERRLAGTTYQEIAASGGGIRSSVRRLRAAPPEAVRAAVRAHLDSLLLHGVTACEAKSGYGLSLESEVKSLEALRDVARDHPVRVVPTFLGAHEFPDEFREDREGYVRLVAETMIPAVARAKLARFCDVFCESGVFDAAQSRRVLEAAARAGLGIRLHADEFAPSGGAELAAELRASSADHLGAATDVGLGALARAGVTPVLLPGTAFFLQIPPPKARRMLDLGLPVALGTDMNPGSSMTSSPQLVWTLACVLLRMTPAEALAGLTVNAAHSLGLGSECGRLAPGYGADLLLLDVPSWRYVPYHFGVNHVDTVVAGGRVAVRGRRRI
ncbi:MAG: imidazolonepropionase [Planctomycetales bacterium]|nr:imidazolonepropionase [Planctomycetales bacterium]